MILLFLTFVCSSHALDNGVGRTPAMGYNTWNDYRCNISQADFEFVVSAFEKLNLKSYGYQYVNMDDCWAKSRMANGTIVADAEKFPKGMGYLADLAHSSGLKIGIYSDRGTNTCAGRPGSLNYEKVDAATYAAWGFDYLKEDSCFATTNHEQAFAEYGRMRDALNETGRPILFSLCGWHEWYAPVGKTLGNSWRISGDVNSWGDVLRAMDVNSELAQFAGPGGFNDPDMLLGSGPDSAVRMSPNQSRSQFSLWSVMTAPLLIGANVASLGSWDLETFTNKEVIAVNQDPLALQGVRIAGGNMTGLLGSATNVWAKKLNDGSVAAVFLNNHIYTANVECDEVCFAKIFPMNNKKKIVVRDLWLHKDVGTTLNSWIAKDVPNFGGSMMYKFTLSE